MVLRIILFIRGNYGFMMVIKIVEESIYSKIWLVNILVKRWIVKFKVLILWDINLIIINIGFRS